MEDDVRLSIDTIIFFHQIKLNQFNNIIYTNKRKKIFLQTENVSNQPPVSIKSDSFPTVDDPESRPRYYHRRTH